MRVPTGYDVIPSEDISLGKIAVPTGTAIGTKDVVKYDAAGNPVPLRIPSVWDPTKIRYEGYGKERSGRALYDNPPPGSAQPDLSAVMPRLRGGTGFGAPGDERGAQYATTPYGSAPVFSATPPAQTLFTPTYGRGTASVPPSAGDTSAAAEAARLHPGTSEAQARAGYVAKANQEAQKEAGKAAVEEKKQTAVEKRVTDLENLRQSGRRDIEGIRQGGLSERSRNRLDQMDRHLDFLRDKTVQTLAQQRLTAGENQAIRLYDDALTNGREPPPNAAAAVKKLFGEAARQGMATPAALPPVTSAPAAAPARQSAPAANIPPGAIEALRANPARRDEFDRYYGPGSAARALGQ
jgi:hypothetical protein